MLGTPIEAILDTEDRDRFNALLPEIREPFAMSRAVETLGGAVSAAKEIGFPVILRAVFALGGLGSGFADNVKHVEVGDQGLFVVKQSFGGAVNERVERS